MLCESTGADIRDVSHAVGSDSRIGQKFLTASVGFGGSCFKKDILSLAYLCEKHGLHEVADYWSKVVELNLIQMKRFSTKIIDCMFNTVKGKKIAIFGYAFKKDTSDARESPASSVCAHLMEDGALCHVYDPKVPESHARMDVSRYIKDDNVLEQQFIFESTPLSAVCGSHAIVVLTGWDMFRTFDYEHFYTIMKKPAFIFDGRNLLDREALQAIGFEVHSVGLSSNPPHI
eukprot:GHVR01096478.1.p1 GENE.GHVR01096478.1~~GHVR01096478.1.p1  ORF type:complete len:231 (+),score=42.63 GHVR01096478.1:709-1401(+)